MQHPTSLDALPYWEGLQSGRLLVQRCAACGMHRHYPRPMCPACHSFEVQWVQTSGNATVHSWTVVHQSALPAFSGEVPYTLLTVDLPEGVRLLGQLQGESEGKLRIGAPVQALVSAGPDGVCRLMFRLV